MIAMTPRPHQLEAASFLAARKTALLADDPRCGKTGAAILASNYILAQRILVITTASGRAVWADAWPQWDSYDLPVQVITSAKDKPLARGVTIIGWAALTSPAIMAELLRWNFDLLISDEDHFAKSFSAARTRALYGTLLVNNRYMDVSKALAFKAERVWCLTGTPLPHSPFDAYPRLRALDPERLDADPARGWPDVAAEEDFRHRYCIVRMKRISQFNSIPVVVGGRNEAELRARMEGFFLRRTQQDIGITEPIYDTMPLVISSAERARAEKHIDQAAILKALDSDDTAALDMHLGPLRRLTGTLKAEAVVAAVKDEFECGLDKIVLAYWHKDVGDILQDGLREFGVARVDGSCTPTDRQRALTEWSFRDARVFLAQIEAAGEAIDLSAAAELWFVETTFSPKQMKQMALRITNMNQKRQPIVKVCVLKGSIDEAVNKRLMMLWSTIGKVIS